jgi:pyroglutamyl-peptidase
MSVLVTGFEPFDGGRVNPSALAARALHGRVIAGHPVEGVVLPVVFGASAAALRAHLDRLDPDLVICVGQAGGRPEIAVERLAVNLDDAALADNAGVRRHGVPIDPHGPPSCPSTLPVHAIVAALRDRGLPAAPSDSAGTFVCNHVFYALMRSLRPGARGGFVHVPWLPEQGDPSLPLDRVVEALAVAIDVSLAPVA